LDKKQTINIACAADNKYAVLATVMLKSLEMNHIKEGERINVYFVDNKLQMRKKQMILDSLDPDKTSVTFLTPTREQLATLDQIPDVRKQTAYHRLLLPILLPVEVKRLIYFDCDLLVMGSIDKLWNTKLESHEIVAAVQDLRAWIVSCDWGGAIPNWEQLGLDPKAKYFNSGVLLIDMEKWRVENVSRNVARCTLENQQHVRWHDQYGLNVVLYGKWKELPFKWNSFPESEEVVDKAIVHFVSRNPNEIDYTGNFRDKFYEILDQTRWAGRRPNDWHLRLAQLMPRQFQAQIAGRLKRLLSPW
jgi:lipopolysaccharide biosynthesis glycosyltransferase